MVLAFFSSLVLFFIFFFFLNLFELILAHGHYHVLYGLFAEIPMEQTSLRVKQLHDRFDLTMLVLVIITSRLL